MSDPAPMVDIGHRQNFPCLTAGEIDCFRADGMVKACPFDLGKFSYG